MDSTGSDSTDFTAATVLFSGGRYKAVVVDKDNYLAQVVRYIHLNPVEAGLVREPESYAWRSQRFYLRRSEVPEWLRVDAVSHSFMTLFLRETTISVKKSWPAVYPDT
jgi:hypothetical protein